MKKRFGPYSLACLALFIHGCATALLLEVLLGQGYVVDLYKGMNLKLPTATKMVINLSPLFSIPGTWMALSACWALFLVRLHRAQLRAAASPQSESGDAPPHLDLLLASHIVLCCLLIAVAVGLVIPIYQLTGCLC